MDPTQAIASTLIDRWGVPGALIVALALVVLMLWRALDKRTEAHLSAVQKCSDDNRETLERKYESDLKLATALDGNSQVMKAALEALKTR